MNALVSPRVRLQSCTDTNWTCLSFLARLGICLFFFSTCSALTAEASSCVRVNALHLTHNGKPVQRCQDLQEALNVLNTTEDAAGALEDTQECSLAECISVDANTLSAVGAGVKKARSSDKERDDDVSFLAPLSRLIGFWSESLFNFNKEPPANDDRVTLCCRNATGAGHRDSNKTDTKRGGGKDDPPCKDDDLIGPDDGDALDEKPLNVTLQPPICPPGCLLWFDGCNSCTCDEDGSLEACTLRFCPPGTEKPPRCTGSVSESVRN